MFLNYAGYLVLFSLNSNIKDRYKNHYNITISAELPVINEIETILVTYNVIHFRLNVPVYLTE